jgi:hypothetical protein
VFCILRKIYFCVQGDEISRNFVVQGSGIAKVLASQLEWRMCNEWRFAEKHEEMHALQQECLAFSTQNLPARPSPALRPKTESPSAGP